MTKYLLAVHSGNDVSSEPITDEEMRRGFEQVDALEREMKAANALLFSGRLTEPGRARVVRGTRGQIRTTDGPYAETKEHLGGFYIIEADDFDAALDWASKVTAAIHAPIEVRPFADFAR
jgi:hypothetical protein